MKDIEDGSDLRKPSICVQIITHNEEKNIGDCLNSVSWADEIIVIDSFSNDSTPDICRGFANVRLVQNPWPGFAKQRNFGLDLTEADWILILDADERITPSLAIEIQQIIACPHHEGYRIPRLDHLDRMAIKAKRLERILRLFRRGKGRYEEYLVHEEVQLLGQAGVLHNFMLHYAYRDLSHFVAKRNEYTRLSARQMHVTGKRFSVTRMLVHALFSFIKCYLIKQMFRAGRLGFIMSCLESNYTYMKYAKLWELEANSRKQD